MMTWALVTFPILCYCAVEVLLSFWNKKKAGTRASSGTEPRLCRGVADCGLDPPWSMQDDGWLAWGGGLLLGLETCNNFCLAWFDMKGVLFLVENNTVNQTHYKFNVPNVFSFSRKGDYNFQWNFFSTIQKKYKILFAKGNLCMHNSG